MTYVFGLIGLGALMLISATKNQSILETLSGKSLGPTQSPLKQLTNIGGQSNDQGNETVGSSGSGSGRGLLVSVAKVADTRFNLTVTEFPHYGRDKGKVISAGHSSTSLHYRGRAFDASGSPGNMRAFAKWLKANHGAQLEEGIFNPGLSIDGGKEVPPSFWGPLTWAGHMNHVHVAI